LARLVIVSNRVAMPRESAQRAGGLAVALREAMSERGGLWFGWSGEVGEATDAQPTIEQAGKITYATVDLGRADYEAFYVGYANGALWPICHYRPGFVDTRRAAFEGYLRVNEVFAKQLAALLQPDDLVWVHDYHFIPLAASLRALGVRNAIGFFLHIPFPVPELLTTLPGHDRLISALCAYDLVGLQTGNDVCALLRYLREEVGVPAGEDGLVQVRDRTLRVGAFPIGIDTDKFAALAAKAENKPEAQRLRESLGQRQLVVGVDRLDYSKGLTQRFQAFQALLERWPEDRGRVTLLQVAPISRGEVARYRELRRELEGMAGRINGRYAEFDWTPVRYLNKPFPRQTLAGFYRTSRVGLVTPIRDGMNLVAKEYVAAQDPQDPGVLVLSRFAGAARELKSALIVNPYDIDGTADALNRALSMPLAERCERWSAMMQTLRGNNIVTWRRGYLTALEGTRRAA
jgi:trehalose 6-phosphate synthase